MSPRLAIACLSHLAWDRSLFQRPQQLMSRFAEGGDVVEYISPVGFGNWRRRRSQGTGTVAIGMAGRAVHLPVYAPPGRGGWRAHMARLVCRNRVVRFLHGHTDMRRILWLQSPAFLEVARAARPLVDVIVYDCMDPFAEFATNHHDDETPALREKELLGLADATFAGGRSLHQHCRQHAPGAICLPSGIDFEHFARANEPGQIPRDLGGFRRPALGYIGAVDERLDWKLLAALAQRHRDWTIVLIGPLVMMTQLPVQEPNLVHLGARPYDQLPAYLRGLQVCLIPWLVNDLTRYMSPTKTPEYLASGRPVVSTPIPDVVADYAEDVAVAGDVDGFIAACEKAVALPPGTARKPASSRTWSEIAAAMRDVMLEA